jgi:hypothetical protein
LDCFYFFPKLVLLPLKALMLIASFAEGASALKVESARARARAGAGARARAGARTRARARVGAGAWLPLDENFKPVGAYARKALMGWRVGFKVILYFNEYYYF